MTRDIINKLRDSSSADDNTLALEYLFKRFVELGHLTGTMNGRKKRFVRYVNGSDLEWGTNEDSPFTRGGIHIKAWFWARYKEYLRSRYEK